MNEYYTPGMAGSGQFGICAHCGRPPTKEGHDGCLGELPRDIVMNACCGHGEESQAYVQRWDRSCIRGEKARQNQSDLMQIAALKKAVTHYTHHRKKAEQCGCTAIRDKFDLSSSGRAHDIASGKQPHPDQELIRQLYTDYKWHIAQAGTTAQIAEQYGVPVRRVQKMVQYERGSI